MPGSISQFLAEFSKAGASRASHFDVIIPIPVSMSRSKLPAQVLTFRCEAGEIPGRQISSADIKVYGPIYKTPNQMVYAETTLTFVETGDMDIRFFFEEWMNLIIDSQTNRVSYPDTYITNMDIRQYDVIANRPDAPGNGGIAGGPFIERDETGKVQRVYKEIHLRKTLTTTLYDAFPTNINQMITAWNDDSFHRLQVTFFYRYYTMHQHSISAVPPVTGKDPVPPVQLSQYNGDTTR